jgi:hypothetical protein
MNTLLSRFEGFGKQQSVFTGESRVRPSGARCMLFNLKLLCQQEPHYTVKAYVMHSVLS